MKNIVVASLGIGIALALVSGPAGAKTKAERQEAKAERQDKKEARQDRKAERKAEKVADAGDNKGMGKFDKNHDGKMSFSEFTAKYESRPAWSYRKDLVGMNIDYTKVSPTMTAILSAVGGSGGGQSAGGGEHNGAASDH